jgi:hypothetical protein
MIRGGPLFQIRPDEINQIFRKLSRRRGILFRRQHVKANVIFQHLGHQAIDPSSDVCQEHQNIRAVIARRQRSLNGIHLPAYSSNAGDQFRFSLTMCDIFACLYPRGICYKTRGDGSIFFESTRKTYEYRHFARTSRRRSIFLAL